MNILDTIDLIEKRDELKDSILTDWNEKYEDDQKEEFSEIPTETEDGEVAMFLEYWEDELTQIEEIDNIEDNCEEFSYGCTLIDEDDFEDFVKEDLEDCGYIPKDLPTWIEINWEATAKNVKYDYSEIEYQGTTYLYR